MCSPQKARWDQVHLSESKQMDTTSGGTVFQQSTSSTSYCAYRKIVDRINFKREQGEKFISFEFFPPRTAKGIENLKKRMKRMVSQDPLFVDFTWGAGGSTSDLTVELSTYAQKDVNFEVNMHITCTNMHKDTLIAGLKGAFEAGVRNICALRGDPPAGVDKWEAVDQSFTCGRDLVKFIKQEYGEYFGIQVAGYPEGHPDKIRPVPEGKELSESEKGRLVTHIEKDGKKVPHVCLDADYWDDLKYLKSKVEAGADVICSQLFYDVDLFLQWVKDCRKVGIHCPILPGIMPLTKFKSFSKMISMCKTRVPDAIYQKAQELQDNAEDLRSYGIALGVETCQKLLDNGILGLHFYTLNLELATYGIMQGLGLKKEPEK